MKSLIKTFAILFSPLFIFALCYAPQNSVGRQMVEATFQQPKAQVFIAEDNLQAVPQDATPSLEKKEPEAQKKAIKALAPKPAVTAPTLPKSVVPSSVRPQARPDPLALHAALLRIEIAATSSDDIPLPPKSKVGLSEEDCLAVANYHEARGEGIRGQIAVSSVVLKRAAVPGRWGSSACQVVRPVMFSFMTGEMSFPPIKDFEAWKAAKVIARYALATGPLPELRHADHYHANSVSPFWRQAMPITAVIGQHIFYADPLSRG